MCMNKLLELVSELPPEFYQSFSKEEDTASADLPHLDDVVRPSGILDGLAEILDDGFFDELERLALENPASDDEITLNDVLCPS